MSNPQTKLGTLITADDVQRDAIHIAVAPVIATEPMSPGEHIMLLEKDNYERVCLASNAKLGIGIVDPFLRQTVALGQRFYMFLYPNTITGLNHVWTHPAFKEVEFNQILNRMDGVDESREWMRKFAGEYHTDYKEILDAAKDWLDYGDYKIEGGRFEGAHAGKEFWRHYARITRTEVPEDKQESFFSCSC